MSTLPQTGKRSARDRLLDAADHLFYDEGIRAVGIDRVLQQSGVAKGSLYYNFGGKDDLVRAYLQNRHAKWAARIDESLRAHAAPTEKILAVFDALGELFAEPEFRGCAFINAAAEAAPGTAEDLATKDFRSWVHDLFATLVDRGGYQDAQTLTAQLILLYDGSNISAQMDHNPHAADVARSAAASLLQSASGGRKPARRNNGSTPT
jgi:AcrR family transcriptional regulator